MHFKKVALEEAMKAMANGSTAYRLDAITGRAQVCSLLNATAFCVEDSCERREESSERVSELENHVEKLKAQLSTMQQVHDSMAKQEQQDLDTIGELTERVDQLKEENESLNKRITDLLAQLARKKQDDGKPIEKLAPLVEPHTVKISNDTYENVEVIPSNVPPVWNLEEAWNMHKKDGAGYEKIARHYGITGVTVKSRFAKAGLL